MKTVTVKYGLESITRQFDDDACVGDIIEDPNIVAGLGLGDNVRVLGAGGVELGSDAWVSNGMALTAETRCNRKAAPGAITVRYGLQEMTKDFDTPPTLGTLLANRNLQAGLGYGDNIRGLLNGVELGTQAIIPFGTTITVETRANTKAN